MTWAKFTKEIEGVVREVDEYGPWFEHFLHLAPWDLRRLDLFQVLHRLAVVKQLRAAHYGGDP